MTEKEMSMDDLEATVQQTDEQLDLMSWKMDGVEQQMAVQDPDACMLTLLKSVTEVRSDYQQLRRELVEVQALQRELSTRLRTQLRIVHTKFARLRQRLANAEAEVRSDYQQLRRELVEVQALQRELSTRLRTQLRIVHTKFARLRQRLANAEAEAR